MPNQTAEYWHGMPVATLREGADPPGGQPGQPAQLPPSWEPPGRSLSPRPATPSRGNNFPVGEPWAATLVVCLTCLNRRRMARWQEHGREHSLITAEDIMELVSAVVIRSDGMPDYHTRYGEDGEDVYPWLLYQGYGDRYSTGGEILSRYLAPDARARSGSPSPLPDGQQFLIGECPEHFRELVENDVASCTICLKRIFGPSHLAGRGHQSNPFTLDGETYYPSSYDDEHLCEECWESWEENCDCADCNPDGCDSHDDDYDEEGSSAPFLRDYSYKPSPGYGLKFFHAGSERGRGRDETSLEPEGSTLYLGLELEMSEDRSLLNSFLEDVGEPHDVNDLSQPYFIYAKYDSTTGPKGFELVSQPATPNVWLQDTGPAARVLRSIADHGFDANTSCGMHVHLSRTAFTKTHLYKFAAFHAQNPAFCKVMGGRPSTAYCDWSVGGRELARGKLMEKVKEDPLDGWARSVPVNFNNSATVELRYFAGTADGATIQLRVEFIQALYEWTKWVKVVTAAKGELKSDDFLRWVEVEASGRFPRMERFAGRLRAEAERRQQGQQERHGQQERSLAA